ncbi:MAG: phosphoribosylglycinamide formyltransferase [Candidatus Margulisiibacteriota bacterium]
MEKAILKIGILISGRGSNLEAIITAVKNKQLKAKICLVVSNNPKAYGIRIAENNSIPTKIIEPSNFDSFENYEKAILNAFNQYQIDLLILAGYMKILGSTLLKAFPNKIMNIHPSLLPAFKGLHAQKQAIDFGVKYSGCTVHFVNESLDAGPIILQEMVPILPNDTEDTLSERILIKEHAIYAKAIQLYAENRLKIKKNKVLIEVAEKNS